MMTVEKLIILKPSVEMLKKNIDELYAISDIRNMKSHYSLWSDFPTNKNKFCLNESNCPSVFFKYMKQDLFFTISCVENLSITFIHCTWLEFQVALGFTWNNLCSTMSYINIEIIWTLPSTSVKWSAIRTFESFCVGHNALNTTSSIEQNCKTEQIATFSVSCRNT
jgi:hypothetical protein